MYQSPTAAAASFGELDAELPLEDRLTHEGPSYSSVGGYDGYGEQAPGATGDVFRPQNTLDFPDRREERQRRGLIKFKLENGVPDVGGLGWRSRTGHLLKNQTYYASKPNENTWNNPTHAGPKTWRCYHGPKLRTDAGLMERLDRVETQQEEWEAKKAFVNTVRVQTLDRLYHQKVENEQKEMAAQWAPHRRARGEVHKALETLAADLDSMPMKELKKVLTPTVLRGDREAIRAITKRIQTEETWKMAWKQMEQARREEAQADLEHRMTYNAMLMELAGQPPRPRNSNRRLPNNCSPRVEELCKPAHQISPDDITKRTDYAGLLHADNRHALEARFPGCGHQLAVEFAHDATEKSRAGWPPPEPPATPQLTSPKKAGSASAGVGSFPDVRKASAPINQSRLQTVGRRQDPNVLLDHAAEQFLPAAAPPAPDQAKSLLKEPVANDSLHMSLELPPRSDHTSRSGSLKSKESASKMDIAPPQRAMVYPVAVKAVEDCMEDPNWRPKRRHGSTASATPREQERAIVNSEKWPPIGSQTIDITIAAAGGLPKADRAGHSDPYAIAQVPGKPRSRVKTAVVQDTENPVWNQSLIVRGWRRGEPLVISVYDHDTMGADDQLAMTQVPSEDFFPHGFQGRVAMHNTWVAEGRIDEDIKHFNLACRPTVDIKISVRDDVHKGESGDRDQDMEHLVSMPGAQPTLGAVCSHLDSFEANLKPVPRLGNFWMTPR